MSRQPLTRRCTSAGLLGCAIVTCDRACLCRYIVTIAQFSIAQERTVPCQAPRDEEERLVGVIDLPSRVEDASNCIHPL